MADHEWRTVSLGECVTISKETYSLKEGWPFINYLETGAITDGSISELKYLVVGEDKIPSRARRKVAPGDIVYSTVRPNQRHFGIVRDVPDNFLASTGFAIFRGNKGIADTDYIYWYLSQDHIVDTLHTIAEHSTSAYPSIRSSDIEKLSLKLPPLEKQQAIAHVLRTLDDKIKVGRGRSKTFQAMSRALFTSWFVDFDPVRAKMEGRWQPGESLHDLPAELYDLFPDRLVPSELGLIPEGWSIKPIGHMALLVKGGTPSTKISNYWLGGTNAFCTPRDMASDSPVLMSTQRHLTSEGLDRANSGCLPIGSVLMSSRAPIGYLALTGIPTAINQGIVGIVPTGAISNFYVKLWLIKNIDSIKARASGSTFQEINKREFSMLPMLVPTRDINDQFDRMLRPLYSRLIVAEKESQRLASMMSTMLHPMMSGNLEVGEHYHEGELG